MLLSIYLQPIIFTQKIFLPLFVRTTADYGFVIRVSEFLLQPTNQITGLTPLDQITNSVISGDQEVVSGRHLAVQLERWLSKGLATPSLFASSSPLISLVFCGGPCTGL